MGNALVDVGLAVNLICDWFSPQWGLGDTEDIFRHRITALKRVLTQAIFFEALIKRLVTVPFDGFGAIGDDAPRGQVNAFEVALADFLGAEVVREIGQPRKRPFVTADSLK